MNIRLMTPSDLPQVFEGWEEVLIHDHLVSEAKFRKAILDNPNYHPNGTLVSVDRERVIGFIFSVAPGGEQGIIVAMYVRPRYMETQLPGELLQCAENYLLTQGAMLVNVGGSSVLPPGVDIRYGNLLECFQRAGYERKGTLDEMECELKGWIPTPYQQEKIKLAKAYGVRVVDYTHSTPEALHEFAKRAAKRAAWNWFWEWWEYGPTMVIALRGNEIIGFANYWPDGTFAYGPKGACGGFGPIGVLPEHRGRGIGTWLLVESMLRVQKLGRTHIWANWANTPFYLPNGWRVSRQFAGLEKTLRT
jgi:GNAT superfamily N-acetyltransferase